MNRNKNAASSGDLTATGKFMSRVLRHAPESIGLTLDAAGWASVDELLAKAALARRRISREQLLAVVANCKKQRFALNADATRIRANQGHSIEIDLGLAPQQPPDVLFHGTATRFGAAIASQGLDKRARHHVHLTTNAQTALAVGSRYGKPLLLRIDARRMHAAGHVFMCSDNGVWLVDHVPPGFISTLGPVAEGDH